MPRRRQRPLVQLCAVLLLLWTGLDMTHPGLCALDNEDAVVVEASTTVFQAADPGLPAPDRSPIHVDDCFCCSHCVEPVGIAARVARSVPVLQTAADVPAALPSPDRGSVFHPPQILG